MKRTGLILNLLAVFTFGAAPAFAQATNEGKPAAPAPAKAAPLKTSGKEPMSGAGGAMMKKNGGGSMKKSGSMAKKHK